MDPDGPVFRKLIRREEAAGRIADASSANGAELRLDAQSLSALSAM